MSLQIIEGLKIKKKCFIFYLNILNTTSYFLIISPPKNFFVIEHVFFLVLYATRHIPITDKKFETTTVSQIG